MQRGGDRGMQTSEIEARRVGGSWRGGTCRARPRAQTRGRVASEPSASRRCPSKRPPPPRPAPQLRHLPSSPRPLSPGGSDAAVGLGSRHYAALASPLVAGPGFQALRASLSFRPVHLDASPGLSSLLFSGNPMPCAP